MKIITVVYKNYVSTRVCLSVHGGACMVTGGHASLAGGICVGGNA